MKLSVVSKKLPQSDLVLSKAILSVAKRLGLNAAKLSKIIGCSEATISRLKSGRGIDPQSKQGELAILVVRLYRSLNAILGANDEQSKRWLQAYNHHLTDVPVKKIQSVEGLIEVIQYLDAMRGKI